MDEKEQLPEVEQKPNLPTEEDVKERKQQVLTQGTASITRSITDAIVIKNENIFFLCEPDGSVPLKENHGFGLYYHDCRYLCGYEIKIVNRDPNVLVANDSQGFAAVFELASPEVKNEKGELIHLDEVGVKWERVIDAGKLKLYEQFTFKNYGQQNVEFPISFSYDADFRDVFDIRGLLNLRPGKIHPPQWEDGSLSFLYEGADGLYRNLRIRFSQSPAKTEGACVLFRINLPSRGTNELRVSFTITETPDRHAVMSKEEDRPALKGIKDYFSEINRNWLLQKTEFYSDSLLLNQLMRRSLLDLQTLKSNLGDFGYYSAGVPWFVTLFGRDSLITGLQTLAFDASVSEETLRLLAKYQGREANEWKDEQPGKILHELRIGELARLGEIPHTPYYGTVDATPLFLILLGKHALWTGDLRLFNELRENVELALRWMEDYGDLNGDGYIEYDSTKKYGLINQGWKDSGNAIVDSSGDLAKPPISLVEVQAYAYEARLLIADLYERNGEKDRGQELRKAAEDLKNRFNRDFWVDELGFFALALQKDNKPASVRSSNPGHALWSGIIASERASQTRDVLMSEEMFSGWGIRTLSQNCKAYNPTGYHLGTVWPHDNALIAAGLRRYGFDAAARKVFHGIFRAAINFDQYRLPELFTGFPEQEYNVPVRYPVACHPQAWAAGSVPFMVESFLGLEPNAFESCLRIVRPILPDFVDRITVRQLRVGGAMVDLSFERTSGDQTGVNVIKVEGDLDVIISNQVSNTEQ